MMVVEVDSSPSGGLGAKGMWRVLGRRRTAFLVTFVAILATVTAITLALPERFQSSVTFLLDRPNDQANDALDMLEQVGRPASLESEIGLMSGRRVVSPVVDSLDLHVSATVAGEVYRPAEVLPGFGAVPEAAPGTYVLRPSGDSVSLFHVSAGRFLGGGEETRLGSAISGETFNANGIAFTAPMLAPGSEIELEVLPFSLAIDELRGALEIGAAGREAEFVELTCEARAAELVADICRLVAQSYLEIRTGLQQSEAAGAAETLREQAMGVAVQLEEAEDALRTYEARNQLVAADDRASESVRQYAALNASRLELETERSALTALINSVDNSASGSGAYRDIASFPTFIRAENQAVSRLVESLIQLEDRRNELVLSRSDDNVDVVNLESRIREVENQLRGFAVSYRDALDAQIASTAEAMTEARADLAEIPAQQVELARLQRQSESLSTLSRFLQERLQEAEVAQAMELPMVRIVDEAYVPYRASFPNVPLNLAAGLLLAVTGGALAGYLREDSDTSIRERDDIASLSQAPVLALIPHMKRPGPACEIARASKSPYGESAAVAKPKKRAESVVVLEAFRNVVGDVRYLEPLSPGKRLRTLAVVSAMRGAGKTFSACNLAIAHTSLGAKTLLIDTDLRAKGVSRFFDIQPQDPGLTDALAENVEWRPTVQEWSADRRSGLNVMPSGTLAARAAELISGRGFDQLVEEVTKRYDVVIFDTPPINLLTDGLVVASKADGVIVVTREGVTSRDDLTVALQRLERARAHVLGVVINGSKLPGHTRSYYYPSVYAH